MSEDVVVDRVERVERPLASRVCRRCNRRLSASASVQNGMGRVCRLKAGVEPEQLKLGLFGEEETAMGGIDSVIEPMGEEDIASMERWNEREEEIDRLRARVAELEEALFDAWSNHPSYRSAETDRLALEIDAKRLGMEVEP
jgi:hypothetical protein